ncbi:hypothetical protein BC830DRAFT_5335 [Chytriomyces sp. MP71]|nr:hypothetical protein BC830DRAFT_5335 [Chytriomyces sp. MP71]
MVGNMPIERSPGVKSDRYGVRIRDSQGSVADVTLWDEVGHACHRLQLGQTVLLHNLSTVLKKGTTDKYYVLGGPDDGTTVFSVSTSMGILSSPILRKIVPLCSAGKDGFYARAVIKSWQTPPEGKLSEYIHPTCTRPLDVKNNIYFCKFCNIFPPHDGVHSILCSLTLDDGTARVDTLVRHRVAEELLNVGAAEFCGCPNARRLELLNALVGREVEVHISGFLDKKTKQLVRRIDAVLPVSNTAVETCN